MKITSQFIEVALARYFNYRINIIVPNVHWGLGLSYECDLVIVTSSGYATEIEIKTSKQDIKNDFKKASYAHHSKLFKRFFYAVPEKLKDCDLLPADCGLLTVDNNMRCKLIRPPRINKNSRKLTSKEIAKILHLGCMRIWSLKNIIEGNRRNECKN